MKRKTKWEKRSKHWWTVILLYPDYMTDGNLETYVDCAIAKDPGAAIAVVQKKAMAKQETYRDNDPDDFAHIATLRGRVTLELGVWDT